MFLDGAWNEQEDGLVFVGLGHLRTGQVGAVLARTIRRIERHLRRRGVLPGNEDDDLQADPETDLAAAAASGQVPPAGPQWAIRLRPPERRGILSGTAVAPAGTSRRHIPQEGLAIKRCLCYLCAAAVRGLEPVRTPPCRFACLPFV